MPRILNFAYVLLVLLLIGCREAAPPGSAASPGFPSGQASTSSVPSESEATEYEKDGTPSRVILHFDETVEYDGLLLQLLALEDSRCPLGVQCIWEGQVVATLDVARNDPTESQNADEPEKSANGAVHSETVELLLRAGRDQRSEAVAGYELLLTSVEPYPKDGVTTERAGHVVTIEIKPWRPEGADL